MTAAKHFSRERYFDINGMKFHVSPVGKLYRLTVTEPGHDAISYLFRALDVAMLEILSYSEIDADDFEEVEE